MLLELENHTRTVTQINWKKEKMSNWIHLQIKMNTNNIINKQKYSDQEGNLKVSF